jgi:PAS domain S-box-containing protein
LDSLNLRYSDTLERMPWPVMVVDAESNFQFWNSAAQRLFGISARSVIGVQLGLVPVESELRKVLLRGTRKVLISQKPAVLRSEITAKRSRGTMEIRFEPLSPESSQRGVLIMIAPFSSLKPASAPLAHRSRSKRGAPTSRAKQQKKSRKS